MYNKSINKAAATRTASASFIFFIVRGWPKTLMIYPMINNLDIVAASVISSYIGSQG